MNRPFVADDMIRLKNAYRDVANSPQGQVVLRDLAKVCHAASTTFDENPNVHARNEGKRLVWLRIQNMLHMSDEEVYNFEKDQVT